MTRKTLAGRVAELESEVVQLKLRVQELLHRLPVSSPPSPPVPPVRQVERRLAEEAQRLSGGRLRARVRLADLRNALPGVERAQVDAALLRMNAAGEITLFPLDNRPEITPADEAAAVRLSGVPQHLLHLERAATEPTVDVIEQLIGGGVSRRARSVPAAKLDQRILSVALQLRGGRRGVRVLLSELRAAVGAVRGDFDASLRRLQAAREVVLEPQNPAELTPEIEAAAVTFGGQLYHLLYVQ